MPFMGQDEFTKSVYVLAWAQDFEATTSGPPADRHYQKLYSDWQAQYPLDTSLPVDLNQAAKVVGSVLAKACTVAGEHTAWLQALMMASDRFRSDGMPIDTRPALFCPFDRVKTCLDDLPTMMEGIRSGTVPVLPLKALLRAEMHGQLPQFSERRTS